MSRVPALFLASLVVFTARLVSPVAADSLVVGTDLRTYQLVRPAAASRAPLVIVLHGNGGTGRQVAFHTGWDKLAQAEGFAAAFPDAKNGAWEFGTAVAGAPNNPDLRFLNKLVATLVTDGTANPRRVYITGVSRGGAMTYAMVCGKGQPFAAAAPIIRLVAPACMKVIPLLSNRTGKPSTSR